MCEFVRGGQSGLIAALLLVPWGCATRESMTTLEPALRARIVSLNKAMEARMRANDMAGVAAFYADDGILLGPGGSRVSGREAIDSYWLRFGRGIDWQLEIHSLEGEAGLVFQRGTSRLTYEKEGQRRTSTVEFALTWVLQKSGEYRIAVDAYW